MSSVPYSIRLMCSILTRGNIISAFLHSKNKNFGTAIAGAQISIGILEEGNRLWSSVSFEDKGISFKPTLIRLMKTFLMSEFTLYPVRALLKCLANI